MRFNQLPIATAFTENDYLTGTREVEENVFNDFRYSMMAIFNSIPGIAFFVFAAGSAPNIYIDAISINNGTTISNNVLDGYEPVTIHVGSSFREPIPDAGYDFDDVHTVEFAPEYSFENINIYMFAKKKTP